LLGLYYAKDTGDALVSVFTKVGCLDPTLFPQKMRSRVFAFKVQSSRRRRRTSKNSHGAALSLFRVGAEGDCRRSIRSKTNFRSSDPSSSQFAEIVRVITAPLFSCTRFESDCGASACVVGLGSLLCPFANARCSPYASYAGQWTRRVFGWPAVDALVVQQSAQPEGKRRLPSVWFLPRLDNSQARRKAFWGSSLLDHDR
jgi:hypothetical protein